eukprot:m.77772 g.77772  ORF g.77772 m.77772 type:complete len:282 (+) comp12512_c0_seq3:1455-2300(+)
MACSLSGFLGNFGTVFLAETANIRGEIGIVSVAVKQCTALVSDDNATDVAPTAFDSQAQDGGKLYTSEQLELLRRFVEEAQVMKRFDHPNILRLLGVCMQDQPLYIITEYLENGDLYSYLRKNHSTSLVQRVKMGVDIARGMAYLHSLNYVHGDLACRNCLVTAELTVKISDFGLSKDTAYKGYYFRATTKNIPLPVRWMSPECLRLGEYTLQSDVWSYGVVLYELMTVNSIILSSMPQASMRMHPSTPTLSLMATPRLHQCAYVCCICPVLWSAFVSLIS